MNLTEENKTLFLGNRFLERMLGIVEEGKAAILAEPVNRQLSGWQAKEKEQTTAAVEVAARAVEGLVAGLNGIGAALERIAAAQEKVAFLMNVDLDETVKAAVAQSLDKAVAEQREKDATRSFIGKGA